MTPTQKRLISCVIAFDLIVILFFLDQASKWWVLETFLKPTLLGTDAVSLDFVAWLTSFSLPRLPFGTVMIMPHVNLVMVWNEGISFGLFAGIAGAGNLILMGLLSLIVLVFGVWMARTPSLFVRFSLAVIIGGAWGNLWDRVRFGAVADFIDLYWTPWHYPAFNVADACIVLGILALVGYEIWGPSRHRH